MFEGFVLVVAVLVVLFVAAAAVALRREARKEAGWREVAQRLGLQLEPGDPLGLAERFAFDSVVETVHGRLDGVEVAAAMAQKLILTGRPAGQTAVTRCVVLREGELVEGMGDWGAPLTRPDGPELEAKLRRAARGG